MQMISMKRRKPGMRRGVLPSKRVSRHPSGRFSSGEGSSWVVFVIEVCLEPANWKSRGTPGPLLPKPTGRVLVFLGGT